jgi:hypothetical protein
MNLKACMHFCDDPFNLLSLAPFIWPLLGFNYLRIFHLSGGAGIGGPWVDSAWSVAVASSASVEAAASAVAAVASASAAAVTSSGVAVAGGLAALLAGLGGRTGCARVLLREVPLD